MRILIKNGHIFTAVDSYVADILVDEGKIRTIGIDLAAQADKTRRCHGQVCNTWGALIPIPTWIFLSVGPSPLTTFARVPLPPLSGGPPVLWISLCSSGATLCRSRWMYGTKRPKAKPPSITAST